MPSGPSGLCPTAPATAPSSTLYPRNEPPEHLPLPFRWHVCPKPPASRSLVYSAVARWPLPPWPSRRLRLALTLCVRYVERRLAPFAPLWALSSLYSLGTGTVSRARMGCTGSASVPSPPPIPHVPPPALLVAAPRATPPPPRRSCQRSANSWGMKDRSCASSSDSSSSATAPRRAGVGGRREAPRPWGLEAWRKARRVGARWG